MLTLCSLNFLYIGCEGAFNLNSAKIQFDKTTKAFLASVELNSWTNVIPIKRPLPSHIGEMLNSPKIMRLHNGGNTHRNIFTQSIPKSKSPAKTAVINTVN